MQKIFVSQPMKGRTAEEISKGREDALLWLESRCYDFEALDTHFKDFNGSRLQFLGKSISEGLALASIALFVGDWERHDGCRCEHFIASQYGVPCLYYEPLDGPNEPGDEERQKIARDRLAAGPPPPEFTPRNPKEGSLC
jgi:hypothetical protein